MNTNDPRHAKVVKIFNQYVEKAERKFQISLNHLYITYNVGGFNTAGTATPSTGEVALNPRYFKDADALKHIYESTIGHEICHHIDWIVNRKRGHSASWKRIMMQMGLEPNRCHSVDLSKVGKTGVEYKCGCQQHVLSTRKHNNIVRNPFRTVFCKKCKVTLVRGKFQDEVNVKKAANTAAPKKTKVAKSGTKGEQVKDLFANNPGLTKVDMMKLIMDTCDMSKAGASTYYYKYK